MHQPLGLLGCLFWPHRCLLASSLPRSRWRCTHGPHSGPWQALVPCPRYPWIQRLLLDRQRVRLDQRRLYILRGEARSFGLLVSCVIFFARKWYCADGQRGGWHACVSASNTFSMPNPNAVQVLSPVWRQYQGVPPRLPHDCRRHFPTELYLANPRSTQVLVDRRPRISGRLKTKGSWVQLHELHPP